MRREERVTVQGPIKEQQSECHTGGRVAVCTGRGAKWTSHILHKSAPEHWSLVKENGHERRTPNGAWNGWGHLRWLAMRLRAGHCLSTPLGGGVAQGLGMRLVAFGGAYWPLATLLYPMWVVTCFGCVNGAPT